MSSGQDRAGRWASPRLRVAAVLALAAFGIGLLSSPADAQRPAPRSNSSVIVDYSVLEELGPAPNVPQVLRPRPGAMTPPPPPGYVTSPVLRQPRAASDDRIRLTPPKSVAKRTAKRPAKTRSKAKAPARTTAKAPAQAASKASPAKAATAARRAEPAAPPVPAAAPPPPPPPVAAAAPPAPPSPPAPPANTARRLTPPEASAPPPAPPPAPPAPPAARPVAAPPIAAGPPVAVPSALPPPAPPSPPPAPSQTAALNPPAANGSAPASRITFESGSAHIGPDATGALKAIAQKMAGDDKLRIQLLAYAGGTEETASQARRLSLSRALAARSYLIGEGVRSTRIDVRALGNKSEGGPPDRIDVVVTRR